MANKKEKIYITDVPAIIAEWDYSKNDISPIGITSGSRVDAFWKCTKCYRIYKMRVSHRANGHGCPYCSGRLATEDNNLLIVNPTLAQEWHPTKNGDLKPINVLPNSGKTVWWQCSNGHEWQASISNRNKKSGCPYCSGRLASNNYNLKTSNPTLAQEWHPIKNGALLPENVTPNSHQIIWWKCEKGHEWQATIYHRNNNRGCPICTKELHTSFPEQAIFYYIKRLFSDAINSYKTDSLSEIDIYIPSQKIGIEYNGYFWHKDKQEFDEEKRKKAENEGITLYRIIEDKKVKNIDQKGYDIVFNPKSDYKLLDLTIDTLLKLILRCDVPFIVESKKDRYEIWEQYLIAEKENSFERMFPKLAKEWHPTKNKELLPNMITPFSGKKVWWQCSNGHEWQDTLKNRLSNPLCPNCKKDEQMLMWNEYDILLKEWDYEKNTLISPFDISIHSNMRIWWKCVKCGHSWQTSVNNRTNGTGCPVCANHKRSIKHSICHDSNNLLINNPQLMDEWSQKNTIDSCNTSVNSHKKAIWICSSGHEWIAEIKSRFMGNKCPFCSNRRVLIGYNDLVTTNPELIEEWDFEFNQEVTPESVTKGSSKKVWWHCKNCGHRWKTSILNRSHGTNCPLCNKTKNYK